MLYLALFLQFFFSNLSIPADVVGGIVASIENSSMAELVPDSSGTYLRLKYPKGCFGTSRKNGCALQFTIPLEKDSAEELWCSYEVYFEKNFDFRSGGKLPGFCGGKCYTGGNTPKEADGWSNRIMWKKDGFLTQYVYSAPQKGKYADNIKWDLNGKFDQKKITRGQWHKIVMHVGLNDVDSLNNYSRNGYIQTWFDDSLVVKEDSMLFRNGRDQKIDKFYFSTFHGGNDDNYAPRWDSFIRFRRLKISRDRADHFQ
ncbi:MULTISPECIES: polysaccharide lyase [unclassified Fibrobacter]|uniref:polysaccharide lyase n=1 Tax=unclassified Fibrobacter TaxID=2634177 RepID=UPI0009149638|nr:MULTISPECIES: hypothetical protein [unclassified Fibrobacter]SHK76029.1 hypothetical protein SAMN05720759_10693 [Fibrobacter sp. UWB12]SIO38526.1 hypothetical protein SAMN05720758_2563 [Fibrobacter sp. UWB11]